MAIFKKLKASLSVLSPWSRRKPKKRKTKKKKGKRPRTKTKRGKRLKKKPARKGKGRLRPASREVLVGQVEHYFPHVKAAAFVVEKGPIRIGDTLRFQGHTTKFKEKVRSLQVNRKPITVARSGDEIGLRVKKRVRQGDRIFKLG